VPQPAKLPLNQPGAVNGSDAPANGAFNASTSPIDLGRSRASSTALAPSAQLIVAQMQGATTNCGAGHLPRQPVPSAGIRRRQRLERSILKERHIHRAMRGQRQRDLSSPGRAALLRPHLDRPQAVQTTKIVPFSA
jgi:hypothetical protein